MKQYREFMKDRFLVKLSFFIVLTATLLYAAFFIIKDYAKFFEIFTSTLSSLFSAFSPLWIGIILAYMLNPLVNTIDTKLISKVLPKKKSASKRRIFSILITYVLIFLLVLMLIYTLISLLIGKLFVGDISEILNHLKDFATSYQAKFQSWTANLPSGVFSEQIDNVAKSVIQWFGNNINASSLIYVITELGSYIFNFFMGVILSIYLISDKEFFHSLWNKALYLILPKRSESISDVLKDCNTILSRFIRGVLLDACIVGLLVIGALSIIKVEFAVFLGAFAGVTNVIPYFGPFIGMVPAFIIAAFTGGIWKGISAVIVIFIIQQIDSNILYPRVVGSSTGLKPLFILLSVIVFGYYMGIVGMIIAVPVTSILQLFISKWANAREEKLKSLDLYDSQVDESDITDDHIL